MLLVEKPVGHIKIANFFGNISFVLHEKEHVEVYSKKDVVQMECIQSNDIIYLNGISDFNTSVNPITIRVPSNLIRYIDLHGVMDCSIDSISDNLSITMNGKVSLTTKNIHTLHVHSIGELESSLLNSKELTIHTSGKSKLECKSKHIDSLHASFDGINHVVVKADIHVLVLDMTGVGTFVSSGKVHLKNITNSPLCDVTLKKEKTT